MTKEMIDEKGGKAAMDAGRKMGIPTNQTHCILEAYEAAKRGDRTLKAVLDLMSADPRKDIYACQGGGYAISYCGGSVSLEIIEEGLRKGLLKEKYAGQNLAVWKLAV